MRNFRKATILMLLLLFSFIFGGSNALKVLAAEADKPIYYEEKVIESNVLPGGVTHKKVKGYSMVTQNDPKLINPNAKEAGSANSKPIEFNKYYSQQVNVLEVPNNAKTKIIPWGIIGNGGWSLSRVKDMANDYETKHPGWKIIAGVNADFFDIRGDGNLPYGPSGSMMTDGDFYKVSLWRSTLGINNSGKGQRIIGKFGDELQQSANPYLQIYDKDENIIKEFEINKINEEPLTGEIATYFAFFDKNHHPVPVDVENAVVVEKAENTLAFWKNSIYGKGIISSTNKNMSIRNNQFAIKTDNAEVKTLLTEGVKIRVQYKVVNPEFKDVDSIVGFHDKPVLDGKPRYEHGGYGSDRYPRNIVGVKEDGTFMAVVIDGRQPGDGFYGVASEETSAICLHYGMYEGFQMDGGGSATMVVLKNGELTVVNSPSDSGGGDARTDSNGILIAMKVPNIEFEIVSSFDKIEFNIDGVENIEKAKDLYVEINGQKKKFENGKITFTGLDSFTDYVYKFYREENGEFTLLALQGIATTIKVTPTIESLIINIIENNGVETYEITAKLNDPDNAITTCVLTIGKKTHWASKGKFIYSTEEISLSNAKEWNIKLTYNLQDGNSMQNIIIKDCIIRFGSANACLDAGLETILNDMNNIFK